MDLSIIPTLITLDLIKNVDKYDQYRRISTMESLETLSTYNRIQSEYHIWVALGQDIVFKYSIRGEKKLIITYIRQIH